MTDREAMRLALEALENNQPVNYCQNNNGERFPMFKEDPFRFDCNSKAIEALRQALEQPEREWQDLTEEELGTAIDIIPFDMNNVFYFDDFEKFGRVVEAKLRDKNGF